MTVNVVIFDPREEFSLRLNRALKFSADINVCETFHQHSELEPYFDEHPCDVLVYYSNTLGDYEQDVLDNCALRPNVKIVVVIGDIFDVPELAMQLRKQKKWEVFGLPLEHQAWQHFLVRLSHICEEHENSLCFDRNIEKTTNYRRIYRKPTEDLLQNSEVSSKSKGKRWLVPKEIPTPKLGIILSKHFDSELKRFIEYSSEYASIPLVVVLREKSEQQQSLEAFSESSFVNVLPLSMPLSAGEIYITNTITHLNITPFLTIEKDSHTPPCYGYRPSASHVVHSAVQSFGQNILVTSLGEEDDDIHAALRLVKYVGGLWSAYSADTQFENSISNLYQEIFGQVPKKDINAIDDVLV